MHLRCRFQRSVTIFLWLTAGAIVVMQQTLQYIHGTSGQGCPSLQRTQHHHRREHGWKNFGQRQIERNSCSTASSDWNASLVLPVCMALVCGILCASPVLAAAEDSYNIGRPEQDQESDFREEVVFFNKRPAKLPLSTKEDAKLLDLFLKYSGLKEEQRPQGIADIKKHLEVLEGTKQDQVVDLLKVPEKDAVTAAGSSGSVVLPRAGQSVSISAPAQEKGPEEKISGSSSIPTAVPTMMQAEGSSSAPVAMDLKISSGGFTMSGLPETSSRTDGVEREVGSTVMDFIERENSIVDAFKFLLGETGGSWHTPCSGS